MMGIPSLYEKLYFDTEIANEPVSAFLEINRTCNLKCLHCYHGDDRLVFMDEETYTRAIEEMEKADTLFLVISGGEPMLHNDFKKIIELCTDKGFAVSIFSNGTLIDDDIIKCLSNSSVNEVNISIYSLIPEIHDKITAVKGSLKKSLEGIKKLLQAGIRTAIKMVITNYNYNDVKSVYEYCLENGIKFKTDPMITPMNSGDEKPIQFRAQKKELSVALAQFPEIREEIDADETKTCNAGKNYYAIDVEGNILPCIQFPVILGNVFEDNLKELWKNHEFLKKIRGLKVEELKECMDCSVKSFCDRCPGLAYIESGDVRGKAESCCYVAEIRHEMKENEK